MTFNFFKLTRHEEWYFLHEEAPPPQKQLAEME